MADDRTLRLFVLYDSDSADAGMAKTAGIAETSATRMGKAGTEAGSKFAAGIESGTSKIGGLFQKAGNLAGQFGIPFSGSLNKIGKDFENLQTKGQTTFKALGTLGGVTVAALVGVGIEAVHLSDQFETAQSQLDTAITNSGNSVSDFKGKMDAAYTSAAKLGFQNTDVAEGLKDLVTATQSPTKALNDLSTAENIARFRHESLSDASAQLAKILGGNTRLLQQWGINLDVGTGKLHSIQSAEESQQKAQLALNTVQAKINDGQLKGISAASDLAGAQINLRNATLNLSQDQKAIPDILDAINQRTVGAANTYGKTLPGQLQIAGAEIHNLGTTFGSDLEPKIEELLGDGAKVLSWVIATKPALLGLAGVVGGVLSASVAVFTYNRLVSLGSGLQRIGQSFGNLATTVLEKTGIIDVAEEEQAGLATQTSATIAASQEAQLTAWTTSSSAIDGIMAEQEAMYRQFGISTGESIEDAASAFTGLEVAAGQSAASVDASLAEMSATASTEMAALSETVAANDAAIESSNAAAGASFTAMLGPIGLVAAGYVGLNALRNKYNPTVTTNIQTGNLADAEKQYAAVANRGGQLGIKVPQAAIDQMAKAEVAAYNKAHRTTPGITGGRPGDNSVSVGTSETTTGLPNLGGVPSEADLQGAGSGSTKAAKANPLVTKANSLITSLDSLIHSTSANSVATGLDAVHKAAMDKLVTQLDATHQAALEKLATQIVGEQKNAGARLETLRANQRAATYKTQGSSLLGNLQSGESSTDAASLAGLTSPKAEAAINSLVTKLDSTHKRALETMAKEIAADNKAAQAQLVALQKISDDAASADALNASTAQTSAQTTIDQDAATAEVASIQEMSTKATNALQAAATAITDQSKLSSDTTAGGTQGISDATQAMNDTSSAIVQGIQDQTAIQVDQLDKTGLYGLQLVAQNDKIALDQQVALDHQAEAAEQAHLDAVTTANNQLVSADQLALDRSTQANDATVAIDQANADALSIKNAIDVAADQATLDNDSLTVAVNNASAQAHVDAVQFGTGLQQQQASTTQTLVSAQGAATIANDTSTYQAAANAAAVSNANAAATLQSDQANAAKAQALAQALLLTDQANGAQQIALATQGLATVTDTANQTEAKLQGIFDVDSAKANTQFAGGGTVIMISGVPLDNAAALGNTVDWAVRTATPAQVGN